VFDARGNEQPREKQNGNSLGFSGSVIYLLASLPFSAQLCPFLSWRTKVIMKFPVGGRHEGPIAFFWASEVQAGGVA
jgi:hypothetical protein